MTRKKPANPRQRRPRGQSEASARGGGKRKSAAQLVVSGAAMAAALGVTDRRVRQMADEGLAVRVGRDRYDLVTTLRHVRELRDESEDDSSFSEFRRRKLALEIEGLELDVGAKRRSLFDMDRGIAIIANEYTTVRTRLLAIPTKCAPIVAMMDVHEDVVSVLTAAVEEALAELSSEEALGDRLGN